MNKLAKKTLINSAIVVGGLIGVNSLTYKLDQTQQAVLTQFGTVKKVLMNPVADNKAEYDSIIAVVTKDIQTYTSKEKLPMPTIDASGAGLKFKLPWQTVNYFDRRVMEWDGAPEQIPTRDKKYLFVDGTARWHISNPYIEFQTLQGLEERAHGKLDDVVDGIVREQVSKRDAIESIRNSNRKMTVSDKELIRSVVVDSVYEGREDLMKQIHSQVDELCKTYGLSVNDFLIKRLTYGADVKKSVEDRMIAERSNIAKKYRSEGDGEFTKIMGQKDLVLDSIRSTAYKTAEQIKGQGDAEATKIYNNAFKVDPDFYSFYQSLNVMRDNVKGGTLVLDKNNQLFKYISGSK